MTFLTSSRHAAAFALTASALAACASTSTPPPAVRAPAVRAPTAAPAPAFTLEPARFADLPGWAEADVSAAFGAFGRQCAVWTNRTPDAPLSTSARYGGQVGQWLAACAAAAAVAPGGERQFFETHFEPARVTGAGEARLTGYYEPIISASRSWTPVFTEPLLKRPQDMVVVELGAFAAAYDDPALRGVSRQLTGQLAGDRVRPYPKREAITAYQGQIIGYAHPADVYNLQVQGSGRLAFGEEGAPVRAAYAAQNGYKWNSALQALPAGSRTWAGLRAAIDAAPASARATLNTDPSYIFFAEEPITDPAAGPRGAAGIPLTAQGSIAVDPAYHPYGAVLFVDGLYEGGAFRRLLVAQDTGGAIKRGPRRGDVFFGSGAAAGTAAERMNAPAEIWTLLPRGAPTS